MDHVVLVSISPILMLSCFQTLDVKRDGAQYEKPRSDIHGALGIVLVATIAASVPSPSYPLVTTSFSKREPARKDNKKKKERKRKQE